MDSTGFEGNTLVSTIASNIQRLSQYVQQLEVLGGKIGSNDDGERLRDQVAEVTSSANALSKETNTLMKRLVELSNDQRYASSMRVHRERLMGDLIGVLNRLQVAQRSAVAKEKESMKAVAAQDQQVSHQIEQVNDNEQQERQQLQIQHQQHLTEIRERSEVTITAIFSLAMRQLDQDISDVTQVMKDLARIVHDQGEIVDSIEANVEHASMQVQQVQYFHCVKYEVKYLNTDMGPIS
uniref:t-SNARE coiled-coil homology domain-containing protein n=1 Tax=Elaeophora elaphi TaxID=1147741 RepID=A0A0R3S1S8_9BILA